FTNGTFGVSDVNYAVGVLAYNPDNDSLFIVGHSHQTAVAEYPIVTPGMQTTVADLPETGDPLQPFTDLLSTGGNPEAIDRITGMLWVDGALIVNAEQWYDAPGDNVDTSLVVEDASDLAGAVDGYFELSGRAQCAGYMGAIPAEWQSAFGAEFYTGWSSVYSIISRYSLGPSLWTFAPTDMVNGSASSNPQINATAFMNYAYGETHLSDRATEWEAQGSTGPFPPASPLWNPLSRGRYGFFVPGTSTFAVIGSTAGLETGIGYKIEQDDGNLCGGPCPYGSDDYTNYYWLFDVEEILAADNVFDPQPYDYGVWDVPFDEGGRHAVIGATLDPQSGTLYVAIANAGQLGDYDRPPLIITYRLP
ncbi:MAG: hypothetical protein JRI23_25825, partial [Deltaproteobacteria bacterium]|nr:hypothetical protein [Deltaproteobacteria bacterium]MBW2535447.1 hypothetical protein [Deltaproteobacteria bacterium]